MRKINLLLFLLIFSLGVNSEAQTATTTPAPNSSASATAKNKNKKKYTLDFENELITGKNDIPDTLFLNSRRLIKYKELFNKRTNYIEEIEANRGLFNDYQK